MFWEKKVIFVAGHVGRLVANWIGLEMPCSHLVLQGQSADSLAGGVWGGCEMSALMTELCVLMAHKSKAHFQQGFFLKKTLVI